jgi:hypothetical protein
MKTFASLSLLLLLCLGATAPAAHQPPGDQRPGRQPSRLYRVSVRDERSGEKRIGFIDRAGKLVIGFDRLPKTTVAVGEFNEGRAVIYLRKEGESRPEGHTNYDAGYIDETGRVIVEPDFRFARAFNEGLAYVDAEGFQGFIDLQGRVVFRTEDRTKDFHEGLAAAGPFDLRGKWGYIDRTGRLAIKRQYSFADDFSEGLAGVEVGGKYGFINKQGEMVIPARFGLRKDGRHREMTVSSGRFSEGLACVRVGHLYGYVNKQGDFVIPPQYSHAQEFSEGLAWVVAGDGKRAGWIDKAGRWAVTGVNGRTFSTGLPEFIHYSYPYRDWSYSEGLAPFVVLNRKKYLWGYMNRSGGAVIDAIFNTAGPFDGGIARVTFHEKSDAPREGRDGYVDEAGQFMEEKYGYIDRTGRFVWREK